MSQPDLDAEQRRAMVETISRSTPHAKALGFELMAVDNARAWARMPYRADLVGDPTTGVIAGGVVTAFLDQVSGMAVFAASASGYSPAATIDLRIDYMRSAAPGLDIFAQAHCYKLTRSIAFVRAIAYDKDPDDPIANATAAFMVNSSSEADIGRNSKPRKSSP